MKKYLSEMKYKNVRNYVFVNYVTEVYVYMIF